MNFSLKRLLSLYFALVLLVAAMAWWPQFIPFFLLFAFFTLFFVALDEKYGEAADIWISPKNTKQRTINKLLGIYVVISFLYWLFHR